MLTLSEVKNHLRVTTSEDDSLITLYIEAVEENIKAFLNRDIPILGESPIDYPAPIKAAMLLMVGDLYENREAQIAGQPLNINPSAKNLLYPYRRSIGI